MSEHRIKACGGDRAKNLEGIADWIDEHLDLLRGNWSTEDLLTKSDRRKLAGYAEQLRIIAGELRGDASPDQVAPVPLEAVVDAAEVRKAARDYSIGRRRSAPFLYRPGQAPARVIDATKNGGRLRVQLLSSGLWHTLEVGDYVR